MKKPETIRPAIPAAALSAAMVLPRNVFGGGKQKTPSDILNIAGAGI